jgi:capsid portal protein
MKKIKIMVDWSNSEVITKKEFEARKAEIISDHLSDEDDWNEWLAGKYYIREVFDLSEQEKVEERSEYLASVEHYAIEEVMQDIEWVTLDVDDVTFIED